MFDMILAGLGEALQIANVLFVLLGVIAGMIAGAIPGVNGPMAIALCIPLSYYMSPVAAIGFLVGLNKGAFFGGSISGVLLNTPERPSPRPPRGTATRSPRRARGKRPCAWLSTPR